MKRAMVAALAAQVAMTAVTAQAEMAMVQGKLLDADGQPVPGYPVILKNQANAEKGFSKNIGFTSENGEFSVGVDQPGEYSAVLPSALEDSYMFEVPADLFRESGGALHSVQDIGTIKLPYK